VDHSGGASYPGGMTAETLGESAVLVALLQTRPGGISWSEITAEVLETGSAVKVWERLHPPTLIGAPGEEEALAGAARALAEWKGQGITVLTVLDPEYPERLKSIHQAPPILFSRGSLIEKDLGVSVVGSRAAGPRGLEIAANVAHELAMRKVTVIAGLAAGIDTAAHRAALDAGGRTVAVIGTGINKVYPASNRALHEEIAVKGLLLSQFWPDAPPQKHTFLMRNATMSGYGIATFVVEAGEISGARAQARMAVEHGRPVILSHLVVERNQWAKLLVDRPGVHVAESTGDVMAVVDGLIKTQAFVGDAFQNLAS
jgi:DNA processing protein